MDKTAALPIGDGWGVDFEESCLGECGGVGVEETCIEGLPVAVRIRFRDGGGVDLNNVTEDCYPYLPNVEI